MANGMEEFMSIPQHLKSISTIEQQPSRITSRMVMIMLLDIAGKRNKDIAEVLGLTATRVSTIMNCPMYKEGRQQEWDKLKASVITKQSSNIVGDALKEKAREAALDILDGIIGIAKDSDNTFARITAGKEVFKRGGFDEDKKRGVTIEISEKYAERWDRVLSDTGRGPSSPTERKYKVRLDEG